MKEKSNLAKVLKEASIASSDKGDAEGNVPQKGSWNFKVHFAWPVVLSALLKDHSKSGQVHKPISKRLDFKDFWNEAVDSKPGSLCRMRCPTDIDRQPFCCLILRSTEVLGFIVVRTDVQRCTGTSITCFV